MSDQVRVKIRIEDATAEQAGEVFRHLEEMLDKVSPLPAEGLLGQGETDGCRYSYTVVPVGGAVEAGEVEPTFEARAKALEEGGQHVEAELRRVHPRQGCEACVANKEDGPDYDGKCARHIVDHAAIVEELKAITGPLARPGELAIDTLLRVLSLPCGHRVEDLIGGTDPVTMRPLVTKCGASLAEHQARPVRHVVRFSTRPVPGGDLLLQPYGNEAAAALVATIAKMRAEGEVAQVLVSIAPLPASASGADRCRTRLRLPSIGRDAGVRCLLEHDHAGPHSYGEEVSHGC